MGSNPNAVPEMYIRGRSGFGTPELDKDDLSEYSLKNNPNLPIFILDGFEVPASRIMDLDMDRIDTYTILKDAGATAMYGSRAANGVVVITTIPPAGSGLNISYNTNVALSVADLSSYNMMNARDKLEAERRAGLFIASDDNPATQSKLLQEYYGKMALINNGANTDWMSLPIRNAVGHKHSLNISGGSDTFRYMFDVRYQNDPGPMKGNHREKAGLGMTLQYSSNNGILLRNEVSADVISGPESPYGSFSEYATMNPYDIYWSTTNGELLKELERWGSGSGRRNPLYDATLGNFNKYKSREFYDNFSIKWYLVKP